MLSSPAFVNKVLDGNACRQPVTLAQFANVRDRFGGRLPRAPHGIMVFPA